MTKLIALVLALASGAGMLIPDPLPIIDEGILLLVLLSSLAHLGLDLRRFFGVKGVKEKKESQTIDID